MSKTASDAAPDLRQYLEQLPSVVTLRDRLQQHRDEGKLLRRLLKLASEAEAASPKSEAAHRE